METFWLSIILSFLLSSGFPSSMILASLLNLTRKFTLSLVKFNAPTVLGQPAPFKCSKLILNLNSTLKTSFKPLEQPKTLNSITTFYQRFTFVGYGLHFLNPFNPTNKFPFATSKPSALNNQSPSLKVDPALFDLLSLNRTPQFSQMVVYMNSSHFKSLKINEVLVLLEMADQLQKGIKVGQGEMSLLEFVLTLKLHQLQQKLDDSNPNQRTLLQNSQIYTNRLKVIQQATQTPTPTPKGFHNQQIGAICMDGWISKATGRGAGSHHGGVYLWIVGVFKDGVLVGIFFEQPKQYNTSRYFTIQQTLHIRQMLCL